MNQKIKISLHRKNSKGNNGVYKNIQNVRSGKSFENREGKQCVAPGVALGGMGVMFQTEW